MPDVPGEALLYTEYKFKWTRVERTAKRMNVSAAAETRTGLLKRLDFGRIRQRGWWIVLLLAAGTVVSAAFVHSWANCRYIYQVELDQYTSHPDSRVRPPQMRSTPLPTVLIRIGGQLLNTAGAWIGWAGGLYLVGLLLGERNVRFGTTIKIVAWSWLPFVVRGLAQCLYMWLTQDPIFSPGLSGLILDNTPPPPGGGYTYVAPTSAQRIWSALLAHLDVYLLWYFWLVVNGLRSMAAFKRRKALLVTTIVALFLGSLGLLPTGCGNTLGHLRLF